MSLFKIFDVAGTAVSAQSLRLNTTASNLANADSVSSTAESAYRARHPVFATLIMGSEPQAGAGVAVKGIVESQAEAPAQYAPEHPLANEQGYIFRSNVNAVEEMVDMISASRSYQTNIEIMTTSKQLLLKTLRLGE